jgi:hypothetical protein
MTFVTISGRTVAFVRAAPQAVLMDYAHPERPAERLSNDDRAAAVAALTMHRTDGRITAHEYAERTAAVSTAQTWGDLTPVFGDLPALPNVPAAGDVGPAAPSVPYASMPSAPGSPLPGPPPGYVGYGRPHRRPLGGRLGVAIVSGAPVIAVLLFFITGFVWGFVWSWLWFLMVPLAGAIVYAPSWFDPDR